MSADERAAMEMQAAMDAERAERAAKAAAAASSDRPEPLCLAVRTSLLSEFRNSGGVLQAFEVNALLARPPSESLQRAGPHARRRVSPITIPTFLVSKRPSRFTFRDHEYEVSIPHENIRVCPGEQGPRADRNGRAAGVRPPQRPRSRASRYTVR